MYLVILVAIKRNIIGHVNKYLYESTDVHMSPPLTVVLNTD